MAGVQWWTKLTELNDIDGDGLVDPIPLKQRCGAVAVDRLTHHEYSCQLPCSLIDYRQPNSPHMLLSKTLFEKRFRAFSTF
jgi:hypothetical protein